MMTQEMTSEALKKQLDEIKPIVQWSIGFAFIATVLSLQSQPQMTILGLTLSQRSAYFLISIVYIALCGAVLGHLTRIWSLVILIPSDQIMMSIESLSNHPWLLNPFAVYRFSPSSRFSGYWGFTGLIVTFWLGLSSLFPLMWLASTPGSLPKLVKAPSLLIFWNIVELLLYMIPFGFIMAIGYFVMEKVLAIWDAARERASDTDANLAQELCTAKKEIKKAADAGIAIGGMVLALVVLLSGKNLFAYYLAR